MMPPLCGETALDRSGSLRVCVLEGDHDGDHLDVRGHSWEPPGATLIRLQSKWGHSHRICWTGSLWVATARSRTACWRTEIEPTPAQLEISLARHAHPPVPRRPM